MIDENTNYNGNEDIADWRLSKTRKLACRTPPGGRLFSLTNTTVSLWYGPYDWENKTFKELFLVRQVGRLTPEAASKAFKEEYNRAEYDGQGFYPKWRYAHQYVYECCYDVSIFLSGMNPSPLVQSATTLMTVANWNIPLNNARVDYLSNSGFPQVEMLLWDASNTGRLDQIENIKTVREQQIQFTMPIGVGRDRIFIIYLHREYPLLKFTSSNAFNYTAPVVYRYTGTRPRQSQQPCVGGATILFWGKHFGYADFGIAPYTGASIDAGIGDYPCGRTIYINDTLLRCTTVPIGAGTSQDLWVKAEKITSPPNGLYDYDAPIVFSVTPDTDINTRGGDIVTIYGVNFGPYDLTTKGRHAPNRNASVGKQWCQQV